MDIEHFDRQLPIRNASGHGSFGGTEPRRRNHEMQASLRGQRILVIEDESLIALLLSDALEEAGAIVVAPCYTLSECLKLVGSEDFDAAILDVDLAGQDVFPAAERIRERKIPFLFHTAHGERAELQSRYCDAPVCRKPTSMSELLAVIATILGSARSN